MKDVPIIFSAPMVQGLLREIKVPGTGKTMTRRLAWGAPFSVYDDEDGHKAKRLRVEGYKVSGPDDTGMRLAWPPSPWQSVKVGDRLWVRETTSAEHRWAGTKPSLITDTDVWYWADGNPDDGDWTKPIVSIHMPRRFSRITMIVTATKIERLTAISEADALAEGVERRGDRDYWAGLNRGTDAVACFSALWLSLHGMGSWDKNPEVVAISARVIKANVDAPEARAA
ncbi:hypothetical protein CO675_11985 [Bradyrhizobium sp. C9]|nr:hypothetical protein CO675_11985 [Bradyrhizobium sp. C9]